jgi:8-oxo-dGTP pyrophosphatase MutT (NUDIX family)
MYTEKSIEEIRQCLIRNTPQETSPILSDHFSDESDPLHDPFPAVVFTQTPTPASVLVPLARIQGKWHLFFIHRSDAPGDAHSGQVAFPGGRAENGENPDQAAVREAQEEIGLLPADVSLLGRLRPLRTITNYVITPVVGVIPYPYSFQLEPREVSRVFSIPLAWLAQSRNRRENVRWISPQAGSVQVIYYEAYAGEVLWGASARITLDFLEAYLR